MNRTRKALFLLLLVLSCVLLTGCYTDQDPWPSSAGSDPAGIPVQPTATAAPLPTAMPQPDDAVDASPGING